MSCSALAGPPALSLLSPQISSRALESAACKVGETECCSSSAVRSEELLYINIVLVIVLVVVVVEDFVSPVKAGAAAAAAAAGVSGVDVLASATFVMALMSS